MQIDTHPLDQIDSDLYCTHLEREWKMSQTKISDAEWLKIVPEAKSVISEKISEWQERRKFLTKIIAEKLLENRSLESDLVKAIARESVKRNEGTELLHSIKHINRLRRLQPHDGKPLSYITPEEIERAKSVPLESIIEQDRTLRRAGRNFVCQCPIPSHNEKSPSFTIFTDTNRFWCFGCSKGGNVIDYVMSISNLNFQEAVRKLL